MGATLPLVPVYTNPERGTVEMRDLRGGDFALPFLSDTVAALDDHLHLMRLVLDLDVARSLLLSGSDVVPPLLLMHSARCGSTLLSSMLDRVLDIPVAREPDAVTTLMAHHLVHGRPSMEAVADVLRLVSLSVGAAAERSSSGPAIVKLSAWQTTRVDEILRLFIGTPAVFLMRDPVATVESMLHSAPPWFDQLWRLDHALARTFFPTDAQNLEGADPPEFLAGAWLSIVEAALKVPSEALLFVDYTRLVAEPAATLRSICQYIGQPLQPERLEDAVQSLRFYAKAANEPFEPAGAHRRSPLPSALAEDINRLTSEVHRAAFRRAECDRYWAT